MERFFYIERVQQWINIHSIITIFRDGNNWTINMQGEQSVTLNDAEYAQLVPKLNQPPHKPEEKKNEE